MRGLPRRIFGEAILRLKLTYQLLTLPRDDIELIICEVTPHLLGLAFNLFPITPCVWLIGVHGRVGCSR
jgi:hypothetical protein